MLDLAVVSTVADADLEVLDVRDGSIVHRAILVWLNLSPVIAPVSGQLPSIVEGTRPAAWRLNRD